MRSILLPDETPPAVTLCRVVCIATVALVAARPLGGRVLLVAGSLGLVLSIACFAFAAASVAWRSRGPHRALYAGMAGAGVFGFLAQAHNVARYVLSEETPHFPTVGLWLLVAGAHPALLAGLAAALGWRRQVLRSSVALDALLLVGAAAIIGIVLAYLSPWPLEGVSPAGRALMIGWRSLTVAHLALVALLLAVRGELLGLRVATGIVLGSVLFAVANGLYGRQLLVAPSLATTANDVYWALTLFLTAYALRPETEPAAPEAADALPGREDTRLRARANVVAILVASCSALVLGFRGEPSRELAIVVATFGVLLALRAMQTVRLQREHAEILARNVVAERELTTALEHRVVERTAELAEAQRVLQRMLVLGQQITTELHPTRVLQRFMEAVVDVAQADGGALALLTDDGKLRVVAATGLGTAWLGETVSPADSAVARVIRSGKSWTAEDVLAHPGLLPPQAAAAEQAAARGVAVVPIQRRGDRIGAVTVTSCVPRRFGPAELARIEAMADMLTVALANAELVETLRQTEWRFRTLFRAAPDAVLTVLQSGRIREANDAVRELTGTDAAQLVGRQLAELVVAEDREALVAALGQALDGTPSRLEVRVARAQGPVRLVALAISRLPEADPPSALLIGRDITADREMRARLLETERMAALGELVAGVAHEVNNPLSSISAFAQLLLRDSAISATQRDSLEVIKAETTRASQVVKDLLAFARRSEPQREAIDLNQIVERTVRLRSYQLSTHRVRIERSLERDLPAVMGDARQLQQVVLNLVTNAIQAMAPQGSGMLHVVTRQSAGQVLLEVIDTGPGIPDAARPRIFEPFFTTKPEGEGTGLGLSVSYGIVTAHGGTIEVAETSSLGTTFVVTLPAALERAEEAGPAEVPAVPGRSPLAGLRLLVVDDEPALRGGIEAFGRMRGFTVITAADGRAGLLAVQRMSVDAIVCDLRMPGMDGLAFHEALRRERPGLATRTVFITGDVVGARHRFQAAPIRQPLLTKPFTLERLEEAIVAVMRGVPFSTPLAT